MIFGTVCSGIGAPEAAWARLGWRCAFMSEIEPFPRAVLAHHYPGVPLHGDFTTIKASDYEPIDLLCGGTPCQSFSVAGLRGGMADERGNLALEFLRLADRLRPRWVVWENVPGVRSSGAGRDFGAFLGGLGELGYGWAYRSLDAQYAGLAQRRERVFVVGYLGDWRPAAAVLFEPASLRGDPSPRRETGERVAPTVARGSPGGRTYGLDADTADSLIAGTLNANGKAAGSATQQDAESGMLLPVISPALKARDYKGPSSDGDGDGAPLIVAHTLRAEGFDASEDGTGRGVPLVPMAFPWQQGGSLAAGTSFPVDRDLCGTLVKNQTQAVMLGKEHNASTQEAHPSTVLRALREAVGAEAFAEWGSGILDPLQRPEVLRSWMHGGSVRRAASEAGPGMDDCSLACAEGLPAGAMRDLWIAGPDGRSPQGRQLAEQLARELGTPLPVLPHPQPQAAVRRLTPREAERLQGFPDDYTLIPYRNGMAADGPRYKSLGNSMAVPVVAWIGRRIGKIDAQMRAHKEQSAWTA